MYICQERYRLTTILMSLMSKEINIIKYIIINNIIYDLVLEEVNAGSSKPQSNRII